MGSAQNTADPGETELGETVADGGFRRVSRVPEPSALARMRALVRDVALGGPAPLETGLLGFQQWRFLSTLCESAWADGARRDSRAARRVLRRRLQALGAQPLDFDAAAALPAGAPVHLRGTALRMLPGRLESHIWGCRELNKINLRLLVEEGHDFLLADAAGQTVCVIAAGGRLINADHVAEGDAVSVFGYVDRVAVAHPQAGQARSPHARGQLSLAVRSGDALPLLVRRAGAGGVR
jgi:hypothetical protein